MIDGIVAEELLNPLAITDRTKREADDVFWTDRIYTVGFLQPGYYDESDSSLVVVDDAGNTEARPSNLGAEHTIHAYVTQDYFGIWPETVVDDTQNEIFYDFTHQFEPVLTPYLLWDQDYFYIHDIPVIPPIVPRIVGFDPDVFYVPAFYSGTFADIVNEIDVINPTVIRRDGDDIVLLGGVFVDTDTFFAPSSARALTPALVTENYPVGDFIYAAGQANFLLPNTFNEGDTFFAFFSANQLQPSLVPSADVVLGPEIKTPGRMDIVIDDDVFYPASVAFSALQAPLVTEADVIPAFFSSELPPIRPLDPFVDHDDTFYAPVVTMGLFITPAFWPDVDQFYGAYNIIQGQVLDPPVFASDDVFYTPIELTYASVNPPLVRDEVDAETFFRPTIASFVFFPGLVVDSDSVLSATVFPAIGPSAISDTDAVLAPIVVGLLPGRQAAIATSLGVVHLYDSTTNETALPGLFVDEGG